MPLISFAPNIICGGIAAAIHASVARWYARSARTCAVSPRARTPAQPQEGGLDLALFHPEMHESPHAALPPAFKPYRTFFLAGIAVVLTVGAAWARGCCSASPPPDASLARRFTR